MEAYRRLLTGQRTLHSGSAYEFPRLREGRECRRIATPYIGMLIPEENEDCSGGESSRTLKLASAPLLVRPYTMRAASPGPLESAFLEVHPPGLRSAYA